MKFGIDFEITTKPALGRSDGDTASLVDRITTALSQVVEDCARVAENYHAGRGRHTCYDLRCGIAVEIRRLRRLASGEGEKT